MSSLQSNERSASVTDKSGTGPSTTSLASDTASTNISGSRPSSTSSPFSTASLEVSTVQATKTKTVVETATATITRTSNATTTTTPVVGDTGLPDRAITGIAVASGVAGGALLLCAIAAMLYLKRHHHGPAPETSPEAPETSPDTPTKASPKTLMVVSGFVGLPNRVLLTGASDSDIKREFSSLGILILRHVDSYYHSDKVSATSEKLRASLRDLHLTEATCSMIAKLCIDPNTRHTGIRHLLALVIFSNLDLHTIDALSLLPPTLKELSRARAGAPNQEQYPPVETALVSWHRITSFLMHEDPRSRSPLQPPPGVESQIDALIIVLQKALDPFVKREKGHSLKDQQAGLAGVIRECVKFGYQVLSHPSDWEFTFPQEEQRIMVVPGLQQRSSSTGELYVSPKLVLAPEIVVVNPAKT